ncbi:homing endonuclease [Pseudomonas phage PspYZU05]|uniref:Homing endonuclease n=1 Tax=Pseudomonas phage PspYZU05 TaxID=1983556 RepID=A0A2U7NEZ1_9CAUD|nr:homing endonuclease [Pseudomonas phage PspYZU05]ASD51971.1 homing endonuclease [Pseudomonas phage PspYZU05]
MESGIYQIKNIVNNKIYVGSAKNFERRWARHIKDLENGNHSSIKLQRSFDLHGNVFEFSILEKIEYVKDIIIERENFWINKLNSKINGYNIADASFGDVLSTHPNKEKILAKRTKTVKEKMESLGKEGRKRLFSKPGELNGRWDPSTHVYCSCGKRITNTASCCAKCRKRTGEDNPFFGRKHGKEFLDKMSKLKLGVRPTNAKRISCDGMIFESGSDAAKHFSISAGLVSYRVKSDKWNWAYINA